VTDDDIQGRIKGLVEREHELRRRLAAGEITAADEHADLARIEVELDQAWDLLRQRRRAAQATSTRSVTPPGYRRPARRS
jgi:PP-loop superfamily ATP-utilizing enzyme